MCLCSAIEQAPHTAPCTDVDILEGNMKAPNRLLLNDGSGKFTEDTSSVFADLQDGGPPSLTDHFLVADVDGDGGICLTHISLH